MNQLSYKCKCRPQSPGVATFAPRTPVRHKKWPRLSCKVYGGSPFTLAHAYFHLEFVTYSHMCRGYILNCGDKNPMVIDIYVLPSINKTTMNPALQTIINPYCPLVN